MIGSFIKSLTYGFEKLMGISPQPNEQDKEIELINFNEIPKPCSGREGYHSHTIDSLRPIPVNTYSLCTEFNNLSHKINNYIIGPQGLNYQIDAESDPFIKNNFWSENSKRTIKKSALNFLEKFMTEFHSVFSQKNIGEKNLIIKIDNHETKKFQYKTTDDLVN